jgi:hypothetical protein
MTENTRPAWLTEQIAASADHVKPGTCPRCGAPILRARAGRIAALDVRADPTPLNPAAEILALLDNRLTWCLVESPFGTRIRHRNRWHIAAGRCTHTVVADHQCPPEPTQGTLL